MLIGEIIKNDIDWLDTSVTDRTLERLYVAPEGYYDTFKGDYEPIVYERSFLKHFSNRDSYTDRNPVTGLRWHEHMIRYLKLLYPKCSGYKELMIHPFLLNAVRTIEYCLHHRKDISNFIGAKSTGKTFILGFVGLALVSIDPEYSVMYVAAPYIGTASSTVFGEAVTAMSHVKSAHAEYAASWEEVGGKTPHTIILNASHEKSGFMKLVGIDAVGKIKGMKARDQERGLFLVFADELNEFQNNSFYLVVDNLISNDNFLCCTSCNYTGTGMDYTFCEPYGRDYEDLDPQKDQIWDSAFNSVTLRFDGELNPHVLGKRNVYTFGLLKYEKYLTHIKTWGQNTPSYWSQIRSFPINEQNANRVMTVSDVKAGGGYEEYSFDMNPTTRVAFLDPAFGGGDQPMLSICEFGTSQVFMPDGNFATFQIFAPLLAPMNLEIDPRKICTAQDIEKISALPQKNIMAKQGELLDASIQLTLHCNRLLTKYGVDFSNFGFDASCQGTVGATLMRGLGTSIKEFDFNRKPEHIIMPDGKLMSDLYSNTVTAMYYTVEAMVKGGQLRGAGNINKAIHEICRREYVMRGALKALEKKADFKKSNMNKSPDDGDAFAGAALMAMKAGFIFRDAKSSHSDDTSMFDWMTEGVSAVAGKLGFRNTIPRIG